MEEDQTRKQGIPKELNRSNLLDILPALEGLECFVFYGSLLGLEREGDIIENDDDIDILVNRKDSGKLLRNLRQTNVDFEERRDPAHKMHFLQVARKLQETEVIADFYFYTVPEDQDYIVEPWNFFGDIENPDRAIHIPKELVFPIVSRTFFDSEVPFPAKAESLCHFLYGKSWRTPLVKGEEYQMLIRDNRPVFRQLGVFSFDYEELSPAGKEVMRRLQAAEKDILEQTQALEDTIKLRDQLRLDLIELAD
jgi:hypothetical protein